MLVLTSTFASAFASGLADVLELASTFASAFPSGLASILEIVSTFASTFASELANVLEFTSTFASAIASTIDSGLASVFGTRQYSRQYNRQWTGECFGSCQYIRQYIRQWTDEGCWFSPADKKRRPLVKTLLAIYLVNILNFISTSTSTFANGLACVLFFGSRQYIR